VILGGIWMSSGGDELSREQLEDLAEELDAPDPSGGRSRAGSADEEWGEGVTHERFSYPDRECSGEGTGGGRLGAVVHQCDLPVGHTSRHMCGRCGLYFTAR